MSGGVKHPPSLPRRDNTIIQQAVTLRRSLFYQVPQFSMSETWMVLGPDLVGWKLTEARVWAMLRDEDSLQARHNDLAATQLYHEIRVPFG